MSEPRPSQPERIARVVRQGGRLLAIGALLWAAWSASLAWSDLLRPTVEPSPPPPAAATGPSRWIEAVSGPGQWVLSGGAWSVGAAPLPGHAVAAWLNRAPEAGPGRPDATLIPLIRALGGPGQPAGAFTRYAGRRAGCVFEAFTRGAGGQERLVDARLAIQADPAADRWVALEAGPAVDPAAGFKPTGWLPLPAASRPIAVRLDPSGAPLGAVVLVHETVDRLVEGWGRGGWAVRAADPEAYSGAGVAWICESGAGTRVEVWASAIKPGPKVLILVRDPQAEGEARQ